ncbi:MAG: hypothetical protein RJA10_4710 [Pseudomonadota bacterium]
MQRRRFHRRMLALAAATLGCPVQAQTRPAGPGGYPNRPIKLIVPYPAGGIVDAVMRAVADPLSAELPQRILIDNRTGADGRIGLAAAAQAAPDGYTLVSATPLVAVGEHLMPDMAGRSKDFAGICAIAAPPSVFVAWGGLRAQTLKDVVALAAAKPGELNVANPGSGSSIHLAQELLFERTGMQVTNVNYRGQPPSLPDLAEGRVHFALISQSLALPLIQAGKLRPLAVNAAKRTRSLPNVPTVAEVGLPEVLVQSWYGVAAPARTPAPIVAYLSDQFMQSMAQPDTRARLDGMDAELMAQPGPELDRLIDREFKRWGELIRKRNIKMS